MDREKVIQRLTEKEKHKLKERDIENDMDTQEGLGNFRETQTKGQRGRDRQR